MKIIDAGKMRICVAATRINGRDYVDVRAFITNYAGILSPTQNGILIPVDVFDAVKAAAEEEHVWALRRKRATLYYFKEAVVDKKAKRRVLANKTFATARQAVAYSPEEHGAERNRGYIFKSDMYESEQHVYVFQPTRPFAVWDAEKQKWTKYHK